MRAIFALLCLVLLARPAGADARITDLQVSLDGNRVLASLRLVDAFDRRLAERLDSGLPTSILYQFELHSDRKRWYDNRLDAATLEVVAMYDAVSRTYTVHSRLDGELIESRAVRDRKALEAAMTQIERAPIFTLGRPRGRRRLLIKARAELGSRLLLSFIPVTITTDWADSSKFRVPARQP
jgi:hypothetical protein